MSHIDNGTLHEYLDGELDERRRAEVESHVSGCSECAERLEYAKALTAESSRLMAELEPSSVQPPPWPEIEGRAAARAAVEPTRRPRVGPWLAWAASIVLAFGVGWLSHYSWPVYGPSFESAIPEVAQPTSMPATVDERVGQAREANDNRALQSATEAKPEEAVAGFADAPAEGLAERVEEQRPATPPAGAEAAALPGRSSQLQAVRDLTEADQDEARQGGEGEEAGAAEAKAAPAEGVPTEPAVDLLQENAARARRELAADKRDDAADAEFAAPMAQISAETEANEVDRFFAVQPDQAAEWLGYELRTLPDLDLQRVEVGPGSALDDGLQGLPAVRLIYLDAANHEIALTMQRASTDLAREKKESLLVSDPFGRNVYRWYDERGYLLTLAGEVSGDSLRALAERVR